MRCCYYCIRRCCMCVHLYRPRVSESLHASRTHAPSCPSSWLYGAGTDILMTTITVVAMHFSSRVSAQGWWKNVVNRLELVESSLGCGVWSNQAGTQDACQILQRRISSTWNWMKFELSISSRCPNPKPIKIGGQQNCSKTSLHEEVGFADENEII